MKQIIYSITTLIFASAILLGCAPTTLESTSTLSPSPSPIATLLCPNVNSEAKFLHPENNTLIDDQILSYVNAGGDPDNLNSFFNQYDPKTLDVSVTDLNDDGTNEILIAGTVPIDFDRPSPGVVYIFTCKDNAYTIEAEFIFDDLSAADIVTVEKLIRD